MSQRCRLRKGDLQDLPARQRTLLATLQWSWERLSPREQNVLAQCSVFEGGISLHAAEAIITPAEDARGLWLEDILTELLDKSWLTRLDPPPEAEQTEGRLAMLMSVQQFVAGQVNERVALEHRHASYFATIIQHGTLTQAHGRFPHGYQETLLEQSNIVVAARRAIARQDGRLAAACGLNASYCIEQRGPFSSGLHLLNDVIQLDISDEFRILLSIRLGLLSSESGAILQAIDYLDQAIDWIRPLGTPPVLGNALNLRARCDFYQGRFSEAKRRYEEVLRLCEDTKEVSLLIAVYANLGEVYMKLNELDRAESYFNTILQLQRQATVRYHQAIALGNLGKISRRRRQFDQAIQYYQQALDVIRRGNLRRYEAQALGNLGGVYRDMHNYEMAMFYYQASMNSARQMGKLHSQCITLGNMGDVEANLGHYNNATRHFSEAVRVANEMGATMLAGIWGTGLGTTLMNQQRYDESIEAFHQAEQLLHPTDHIFYLAHLCGQRAQLEAHTGRLHQARAYLSRGQTLVERNTNLPAFVTSSFHSAEHAIAAYEFNTNESSESHRS